MTWLHELPDCSVTPAMPVFAAAPSLASLLHSVMSISPWQTSSDGECRGDAVVERCRRRALLPPLLHCRNEHGDFTAAFGCFHVGVRLTISLPGCWRRFCHVILKSTKHLLAQSISPASLSPYLSPTPASSLRPLIIIFQASSIFLILSSNH